MKRGKKYMAAAELLKKEFYPLGEAIELLKKTVTTKFDASCEVHFNLGLDPRQAEQNIRTTVTLPHGTGKKLKVVAFVSEAQAAAAKAAGADEAGTEELMAKIEKGWLDFDIAVATPDQMKGLGKIAKVLGQKKLMPSPKSGTVTTEFEAAIRDLKKGKIEIRVDKTGIAHLLFGKASFEAKQLEENFETIMAKILEIKPSSSKGTYVRSVTLATTMGPGVPVDTADVLNKK